MFPSSDPKDRKTEIPVQYQPAQSVSQSPVKLPGIVSFISIWDFCTANKVVRCSSTQQVMNNPAAAPISLMDAAHRHEDTLNYERIDEGGHKVLTDIPIKIVCEALGLPSSHPVATCCTLLLARGMTFEPVPQDATKGTNSPRAAVSANVSNRSHSR